MNAIEFTTELNGDATLTVPKDLADQLPRTGRARVLVLTETDAEEVDWRRSAYPQFLRDDSVEDSIYDSQA